MAKLKKKAKECSGCGDPFITLKNYDYCKDCSLNGSRYVPKKSPCSECDGSGKIKFRNQKSRPCKLCAITNMNKKNIGLNPEEKFWAEVEKSSKYLIANLIERNLPISAVPKVFDLEKDVEYRMILRDYVPSYYSDNEEYQAQIIQQNWTADDVEYVAQEVALWYFFDW